MTIRTQLKAGRAGSSMQHNEALQVRSALKAGGVNLQHNEALKVRTTLKAGIIRKPGSNHNETLKVRTALKAGGVNMQHNEALKVRTALKAGGQNLNHNEALRREPERPAISMRRQPRTTARKEDRLELLVVRAGLRAGRASLRSARSR